MVIRFLRQSLSCLFVSLSLMAMVTHASPLRPPRSYSYDNNQSYAPWQGGQGIGEVSFTLSEPVPETNKNWFLTGLKLLHAFEYPQARAAFSKAQDTGTGQAFIMAIWGELMCSYQILWYSRQFATADALLSQLNNALDNYDGTLNDSETVLIDAAKRLFSSQGRDLLPAQSGSNVQEFFLHLDAALAVNNALQAEVKVFRLLGKLATRNGIRDTSLNTAVVSAIRDLLAQDETRNHPGLHHYLIHAAESPDLAINRISDVYPSVAWLHGLDTPPETTSSIHLTHMPTHFYFAWGDWVQVVNINLKAWNKSLQRQSDLNTQGQVPPLTDASLAFHEHLWRVYALLQQGRWDDAFIASEDLYNRLDSLQTSGLSPSDLASIKTYYAYEYAYLILELPERYTGRSSLQRRLNEVGMSPWGLMAARFTRAWQALQQHNFIMAETARAEFVAIRKEDGFNLYPANIDALPIMEQQLLAEELRQKGDIEGAIEIINAVTDDYDRMRRDHGVPVIVKPVYEYLGELYLEVNTLLPDAGSEGVTPTQNNQHNPVIEALRIYDNENAMTAFKNELRYFPRRRQTLKGMLTASAANPALHSKIQAEIDDLVNPLVYDSLITPPPCQTQADSSGLSLVPAMLLIFPVMTACISNAK